MYFVCFSFIGNSLRHIYSQLATSRFFFYLFSTPTSVITKNHKLPSTRVHLYAKKNSINRVPQKLLFFRRLFCAQSFLLSVCVCVCDHHNSTIHMTKRRILFCEKFHLPNSISERFYSLFTILVRLSKTQTQRRRRRQWREDEKNIIETDTRRERERKNWNKNYVTGIWRIGERKKKKKVIYIPRAQREYHFCRSFAVRQQGQIVISSLFFFVI